MKRLFDRDSIATLPLSDRVSKLELDRDAVDPLSWPISLSPEAVEDVASAAAEIRRSRSRGAPVILAFGAHAIKNGLAQTLIRLMEGGHVTHFATNGAGIIHDWEFAFQGSTGEDVRRYVSEGQFGIWEETGAWLNLSLAVGAWRGLGYGEAVGTMVQDDGLQIPTDDELVAAILAGAEDGAGILSLSRAAAAADLRALLRTSGLEPGFLRVDHPRKKACFAAAAVKNAVPFTCHPMFGHDIIYTHPLNRGAVIGRTAETDFLSFADSVSGLEGGVYLSVGSAVMSPMIFEKALSMARNKARQDGRRIEDFSIHVVDLAVSTWDWKARGEPPQDDPSYFLRYCKTFSRMGGTMTYTSADNRSWLVALLRSLEN
jgi:hypothetical protein